jgi:hypothetical protein
MKLIKGKPNWNFETHQGDPRDDELDDCSHEQYEELQRNE